MKGLVALLGFLGVLVYAASQPGVLQGTIDPVKLQNIFKANLDSQDVPSLYYALKGYKQLNLPIPIKCDAIQKLSVDTSNIESVFYLANIAAYTNCLNVLKPEVLQAAVQVLEKKDASIQDIYYAVFTLKALGKGSVYDKEDALKNLIQLLKKDDSVSNYGFTFLLCEHMGCAAWTATHAESVLQQADETDGRALHWEGGLPVTSTVLSTLLRSHKTIGKLSPLTAEQSYKFAEYLLSRRSVNTPKGAALLLEAATALANEPNSPLSISIKGRKQITQEQDTIEVSISDLLGRPVKTLKAEEVVAQSGTRLADDVVVLSKQPLVQNPANPTLYTLNLSKIKSQYGQYKIALSAGSQLASLSVAVLGEIQVKSVEIGVGDIDGTTSPKTTVVTYPKALTESVHADHLQKVSLKFTIQDKSGKPVKVQQAFLRIGHTKSQDEIIFVAEPDSAKSYKVDLNVGAVSKHFGHESGIYELNLLIGDSAIANPIDWKLGSINFKFSQDLTPTSSARARRENSAGAVKPEIAHEFRVAEARPPRLVSDVFACACAAPLLLLLVLWARLRVNLSLFPLTLSAILFHTGLASILGLFVVFWLHLTMFETVRYLLALGFITFISGHRLLRHLVASKKIAH